MPPKLVALGLASLTLAVYLIVGKRTSEKIEGLDDFLFYGRALEKKGYTRTFIATGISLATVLAFFLDFGSQFGLALVLSPLMFLTGVWVFLRALPVLEAENYLARGSTLHAFLGRSYNGAWVRWVTAVVSLLGYVGILIIELHVGVTVFHFFSSALTVHVLVALFFLLLIFAYTWLGGYRAVVDTDRIQLALVLGAVLFGLGSLTTLALKGSIQPDYSLFEPAVWRLPAALAIVMIVGNIPLQFVRMSNWQRAAAVGDKKVVHDGLVAAIWATFAFWLFFNIMGVFLGPATGSQAQEGVVRLLEVIEANAGFWGAYVAMPVVFAGLIAALVSTADSVFVPILTSWVYDFRHHRLLHDGDGWVTEATLDEKAILRSARHAIPGFLAVVAALYVCLVYLVSVPNRVSR
jgi:Na+/proline symporter